MASYPTRARRRANGEGSVYRTAEGRWRGAVTWIDVVGKSHRQTVSGKTQAEVRQRVALLRRDIDRGITPASKSTLADFIGPWLVAERQRIRPSTWAQRELHVRRYIVPAIGSIPLAKLAPADVERMTTGLIAGGLSPRTAATARVILRRALGDALRDELVHRNVAALARPPRVPSKSIVYLDSGQLRQLRAAAQHDPIGPLVTLAATTGMRQGEILGLAWGDVDLEAGLLTVRRSLARAWTGWELSEPKTNRSRRTISLPTIATEALRRQADLQSVDKAGAGSAWQDRDALVFTDAFGRPLVNHRVTYQFQRLLDRAGLPKVPFHALRHSTATALLAVGVPLRTVADLLGHSGIAITADTYGAVVPELRREAADAIDRVLR